MIFSIVIPTIGRTKALEMMLASLKNQTIKDFEVLVIDQNEKGFLDAIIQKYQSCFRLKHLITAALGASNARNVGIKNAVGNIITFPDDDCEYPNDFLETVYHYFQENSLHGIVVTTKDKQDGKPIARLATKPVKITRNNVLKTVIEAGIFVKRECIKNHLFDINMGVGSKSPYWSDEGPDFILKLLKDNCNIQYCPQFKMFHPNPVKKYTEQTAIRAYRYGKGRGYFLKKNNYSLLKIAKYLLLYLAGMVKGLLHLNRMMFVYFKQGFRGRFEGYFKS